jgi:electron transfer flavoprotein alpha subunit
MKARIFVCVPQQDGVIEDSAATGFAAARKIDAAAPLTAIVLGIGPALDAVATQLCASYAEVWKVGSESFSHWNAETVRPALAKIVPKGSILLMPHDHFAIDLAPGLSIKLEAAFVADVVDVDGLSGSQLKLVRQEFGGQVSAHVVCDISAGAVITVRPGALKPITAAPVNGTVIDKSAEIGPLTAKRRYLETVVAESGDVDITKHDVLVSVGRGIGEQENISIAEELAEALGGAVSCSRPVADAKWLDKSRQVGTSGKTVKPKVYIACGISGAFQHVAGLKGNPLIIAINKNPKAPIFQVADVGIVDDLLEFLPALTEKVRELHTVSK